MGKIRVLPDQLINQIAAGEIVERPASVVKELVENSLDAGAARIEAEIDGGGRSRITIRDDGEGMSRDDALLAFEHHATSKLRAAADLERIATLGFRGEALPSIAAVSRLTLRTATAAASGDQAGTLVEIHGGTVRAVKDIPWARGTEIEVADLFLQPAGPPEIPQDGSHRGLPRRAALHPLRPGLAGPPLQPSQQRPALDRRPAGPGPGGPDPPALRRGIRGQPGAL